MTRLRTFLSRLWALVRSRRMDQDIDDEITSERFSKMTENGSTKFAHLFNKITEDGAKEIGKWFATMTSDDAKQFAAFLNQATENDVERAAEHLNAGKDLKARWWDQK